MNGPIKIILIATMAITLFFTSGCASTLMRDLTKANGGRMDVTYPSVRLAGHTLKHPDMLTPLVLIDLPFSAALDTVMLPLDAAEGRRPSKQKLHPPGVKKQPITKSDKLPTYEPREGDLVFQALPLDVDLIQAIEGITQSHYSHVGVLHLRKGKWTVIEACAPGVIYTPFEKWKKIGRNGRWAVYRLKPKYRPLIPKFLKNLHSHAGKPYDFKYEFTDDKLYCSELVFHAWKKATQKNMGKPENVLTLNWKPYQATIEKYNQGPLPASGRILISPISLSRANQLERVYNHGLDQ